MCVLYSHSGASGEVDDPGERVGVGLGEGLEGGGTGLVAGENGGVEGGDTRVPLKEDGLALDERRLRES